MAELDPRTATEQARTMLRYVQAFNGEKFSPAFDDIDRQNLATALDNLEETAAMLLNMAGRVQAAANCLTCGGSGWLGGPSFYNPGEGGEPCPDCTPQPTPAPGAPAGWINVVDRLPVCNHEDIFIGINTAGFAGAFNAIQEIDGTLYCLYYTPEKQHSVMSDLQCWQRMPAAPGQEAAAVQTLTRLTEWAQAMHPEVSYSGDHPIAVARRALGAGEKTS